MTVWRQLEPIREDNVNDFPFVVLIRCSEHVQLLGESIILNCEHCRTKEAEVIAWLYENLGSPTQKSFKPLPRWAFSFSPLGILRRKQIRFRTQEDAALFALFCK